MIQFVPVVLKALAVAGSWIVGAAQAAIAAIPAPVVDAAKTAWSVVKDQAIKPFSSTESLKTEAEKKLKSEVQSRAQDAVLNPQNNQSNEAPRTTKPDVTAGVSSVTREFNSGSVNGPATTQTEGHPIVTMAANKTSQAAPMAATASDNKKLDSKTNVEVTETKNDENTHQSSIRNK